MIAKDRQANFRAMQPAREPQKKFSLSAILDANSRIKIEQFRKQLPADSSTDRMSPAAISSQRGFGDADSPCRFGAKVRLTA